VSEQIWGPIDMWDSIEHLGLGFHDDSKRKWIGEQHEILFISREYNDAMIEFKRCSEINDNYAVVEYFFGLACREIEDENVLVHFNKAKERNDVNPYFDLEIAYYRGNSGDKSEAETVYNNLKEKISDNPGINNYEEFYKNGTNLCILIEKGLNTKWDLKNGSICVKIDSIDYGKSYFLETTASKQSLKSVFGNLVLESIGDLAKDKVKGAAGKDVTGGGVVTSIFMGGKRKHEIATWLIKPPFFYVYETYLEPGEYEITVESVDKKGKIKKSKSKKVVKI